MAADLAGLDRSVMTDTWKRMAKKKKSSAVGRLCERKILKLLQKI